MSRVIEMLRDLLLVLILCLTGNCAIKKVVMPHAASNCFSDSLFQLRVSTSLPWIKSLSTDVSVEFHGCSLYHTQRNHTCFSRRTGCVQYANPVHCGGKHDVLSAVCLKHSHSCQLLHFSTVVQHQSKCLDFPAHAI